MASWTLRKPAQHSPPFTSGSRFRPHPSRLQATMRRSASARACARRCSGSSPAAAALCGRCRAMRATSLLQLSSCWRAVCEQRLQARVRMQVAMAMVGVRCRARSTGQKRALVRCQRPCTMCACSMLEDAAERFVHCILLHALSPATSAPRWQADSPACVAHIAARAQVWRARRCCTARPRTWACSRMGTPRCPHLSARCCRAPAHRAQLHRCGTS